MKAKMRTLFKLLLAAFILSGCNQNPKSEVKEVKKNDTNAKTEKPIAKPTIDGQDESVKIEHLNQLIAIDTVDSKSKDVFKKYGLEFNGNCYACDLASLSITEKSVKLTNVCDTKVTQEYDIVKFYSFDKGIEIKTRQTNFSLTKIDKAPIYELKIIGTDVKIENLRISKYYTLKKILNKFEQHDCGDFQG
jgi:uncharacterized protein YcfL